MQPETVNCGNSNFHFLYTISLCAAYMHWIKITYLIVAANHSHNLLSCRVGQQQSVLLKTCWSILDACFGHSMQVGLNWLKWKRCPVSMTMMMMRLNAAILPIVAAARIQINKHIQAQIHLQPAIFIVSDVVCVYKTQTMKSFYNSYCYC